MKLKSLGQVLMLTGAMAAGGAAYAAGAAVHTDSSPTYNVPQRAGEASTMTEGRPNLLTHNPPRLMEERITVDAVPMGSQVHLTVPTPAVTHSYVVVHPPVTHAGIGDRLGDRTDASPTYNVPIRAGEASTMTQGRPNLLTHNPVVTH